MDSAVELLYQILITSLFLCVFIALVGHFLFDLNDPWSPSSFEDPLSTVETNGCRLSIKTWTTQITKESWDEKEDQKQPTARLQTWHPPDSDSLSETPEVPSRGTVATTFHAAYGKRAKELFHVRRNVPLARAVAALSAPNATPAGERPEVLRAASKLSGLAKKSKASAPKLVPPSAEKPKTSKPVGSEQAEEGVRKSREVVGTYC